MKVFVPAPGPRSRTDYCRENGIGLLYSPHRPETPTPETSLYIVDNGAFPAYKNGTTLDIQKFYAFLGKIMKCHHPPYFITIPDIVCGGKDSFDFSLQNLGKIPEQFKKYFVVQDGFYPFVIEEIIPFVDGIFVGGSVLWKWRTAHIWVELAHEYKKKCHIGRVGTCKNFLKAYNLGADSIDGSTLMRHNKLHKIHDWNHAQKTQHIIEKDEWLNKVGRALEQERRCL